VDWLRNRSEKRKILILFTTTVDRESYGNLEEYRDMLREADIELFVISYAPNRPSGIGRSFEERMNPYFFKKLVAETAGWVYIVGAYVYLEDLFTDFKGRLNNHYTVGFYVDPLDSPREHEVQLEIERERCKVSHRKVLIY
jgi:MoaA/NifB/PqqE/SkfB family radical SAM enzyme